MSELDQMRQRAESVARWREHFLPPQSKIDFSQRDVPHLLAALDAVLALANSARRVTVFGGGSASGMILADDVIAAIHDELEPA